MPSASFRWPAPPPRGGRGLTPTAHPPGRPRPVLSRRLSSSSCRESSHSRRSLSQTSGRCCRRRRSLGQWCVPGVKEKEELAHPSPDPPPCPPRTTPSTPVPPAAVVPRPYAVPRVSPVGVLTAGAGPPAVLLPQVVAMSPPSPRVADVPKAPPPFRRRLSTPPRRPALRCLLVRACRTRPLFAVAARSRRCH